MRLLHPSLLLTLALVVGVLSCAAPGTAVAPQPGDFAFLQVDLRG